MLPRFGSMKVVTGVSELHVTRCELLRRLSFPRALADFSQDTQSKEIQRSPYTRRQRSTE